MSLGADASVDQIRRAQEDMQRQFNDMTTLIKQTSMANLALQQQQMQLLQAQQQQQQQQQQMSSPPAHQHTPLPAYAMARTDPYSSFSGQRQNSLELTPTPSYAVAATTPHDGPARVASSLEESDYSSSPSGASMSHRLERMRSRKKVLDDMMKDLPR